MSSSPNLRRAAALLANLPADDAKLLLRRFSNQEIATLAAEFVRTGIKRVDTTEYDAIAADFKSEVLNEVQSFPLDRIGDLAGRQLLQTLQHEHPQTIAAIVSCLPRKQAVDFIAALPDAKQTDLIQRIATSLPLDREILADLLESLAHCSIGKLPRQDAAKRCA